MVHTSITRNCVVFVLSRRQTRSANSNKWLTVFVRKAKGKPRYFEENVCGSLYSTFKASF